MSEENLIKVLLVEPFNKPKIITIENNYQAISEIICGDADEYMPFEDDVALLCNADGKRLSLSASHTVTAAETGKTELIYGSFILVGTSEFDTEYHSLDDNLIDKYMDLFENERFNYSQFVKLIRIKLPNELKGTYSHKDYLSGIMKLGIKREKLGDILVFEDGADIVASLEICEYVVNNLQQLTRFSKATITELNIKEIREPNVKKEEIRIVVASLRLDAIVAELAKCSRNVANEIIENQRVFINYENESRSSKLLSEGDIIVIRGKGKFIVKLINGETRKGKLSVTIEHYI